MKINSNEDVVKLPRIPLANTPEKKFHHLHNDIKEEVDEDEEVFFSPEKQSHEVQSVYMNITTTHSKNPNSLPSSAQGINVKQSQEDKIRIKKNSLNEKKKKNKPFSFIDDEETLHSKYHNDGGDEIDDNSDNEITYAVAKILDNKYKQHETESADFNINNINYQEKDKSGFGNNFGLTYKQQSDINNLKDQNRYDQIEMHLKLEEIREKMDIILNRSQLHQQQESDDDNDNNYDATSVLI